MLVNAYCTHRDPPPILFPHTLRGRRDTTDPELAGHLQGFMGFVMDGGKRPMTAMRYAVIRHLERVRHHVSLEIDPSQLEALEAWAIEANALVFLPDATVRAPNGAVLVDPSTGEPQPGATVPHPRGAQERKRASDGRLAELGVAVPASLPPVVDATEVALRSADEVAARAIALFACAVRAESLTSGKEIPVDELEKRLPLAFASLSPKERAFLFASTPNQQDVVNHLWRYEALAVLAWSLGWLPELPLPSRICDVPALAKAMLERGNQDFVDSSALRPTAEILDALDMHFRFHWATTDARVKKGPPPAGLEPGVVAERHHALNWLARFEDAAWDDVDTPT